MKSLAAYMLAAISFAGSAHGAAGYFDVCRDPSLMSPDEHRCSLVGLCRPTYLRSSNKAVSAVEIWLESERIFSGQIAQRPGVGAIDIDDYMVGAMLTALSARADKAKGAADLTGKITFTLLLTDWSGISKEVPFMSGSWDWTPPTPPKTFKLNYTLGEDLVPICPGVKS